LSAHKGFTARAKDWEVVYSELTKIFSNAREQEIKKWKSKVKIEALISK
jgi:putative endonuclease